VADDVDDLLDQVARYAAAPPVRIDEEVLKLRAVVARGEGREPGDPVSARSAGHLGRGTAAGDTVAG
jgi:hypothetical protein